MVMNTRKERLIAKIETNSWDYGRKLVPEQLLKSYEKVHVNWKRMLTKSLG